LKKWLAGININCMKNNTNQTLSDWVNLDLYALDDPSQITKLKTGLDRDGVVTLPGFLRDRARLLLIDEANSESENAFFNTATHNVYLTPSDRSQAADHVINRQVASSKGCITADELPADSGLQTLDCETQFQAFLASILDEEKLYPYADPQLSINVHYAHDGQELGWHFDNSSFAITLLLQAPKAGGQFEYVPNLRDSAAGEMNFTGVTNVLDGTSPVQTLEMQPGTLVLFRGRDSMHRVMPTLGDQTRLLVVLAYNDAPGVSLSEAARMTFYGRVGV
jgi:hypothetical protein